MLGLRTMVVMEETVEMGVIRSTVLLMHLFKEYLKIRRITFPNIINHVSLFASDNLNCEECIEYV